MNEGVVFGESSGTVTCHFTGATAQSQLAIFTATFLPNPTFITGYVFAEEDVSQTFALYRSLVDKTRFPQLNSFSRNQRDYRLQGTTFSCNCAHAWEDPPRPILPLQEMRAYACELDRLWPSCADTNGTRGLAAIYKGHRWSHRRLC
jgi:hypothetical protein